jgi:transcriptional regulator with XRE-family HTH domain
MMHSEARWRTTYLRAWRKFRDVTLEAASEPMGITHGQLSRIERGLQPYSQEVLEVAADLYGCTVQDLLTRTPTEDEAIFSLWSQLSEQQRRYAAGMLRGLLETDKKPQ